MAETPTYKIELDFPSTSVNAEVPTEQKIRQYDTIKETITTENESVTTEKTTITTESDNTVTEQEFLSPPIFTVTEKQSTFTKGDMTFQKVTVTEDVSKTNGHKFIRTESQMSVENSRMYFDGNEPGTPRNSESSITYETTEYDSRTEKEGKEKRSKIPMFRLKQAVEMVQNDQRDKKTRNKLKNAPRRSSIPKLKDTKMAIKVEPPAKPKLEDEFDKIYDEIVDNNTKDIDNKILTVKIEDPAKIESKFEEIIHAYDENAPETQSVNKEVLRLSKIPALRKKDDDRTSKLGAIVNRVKSKDNVTETKLKDGGFKISSTKITTKRFSREDSKEFKRELSLNEVENKEQISTDKNVSKMPIKTTPTKPERRSIKKDVLKDGHKVDVTETYEEIEDGTKRTIKRTVITENVEVNIPVNTEKVYHSLSREQSKDAPTIEIFKSVKDSPANRIIKETTIKSTGIPIKSSKIKGNKEKKYVDEKADIVKLGEKISREKYAINTAANNGSSETVDIEEYTDENGQKVIKKTIVKEQITIGAPIITERVISEVKSTRTENGNIEIGSNNAESEMVEIEEIIEEEIYSDNSKEFNSITDDIVREHTNIRSKANIVKPVLKKASNNNSKGQINNVEVNKSIEWKQGDKVQSKTFSRSQSENVIRKVNSNGTLKKSISKIETKYTDDECKSKKNTGIQDDKPEVIIDRNARYEENKSNSVVVETKPTELNSKEHTFNKQFSLRDSEINFRNKEENVDVTDPTENSKPTSTKLIKVTKERDQNTNSSVIDEEEDITQIKGNVSRLINKFVNKESNNSPKDEEVPKKKTLLSKIAIFERVEPLEIPLKNNITLERKTTKSISKEITIDQETKGKEIETESQTTGNINENITIDNNDADQGHSDTPIIVKEIWKFNGAASPLVTSPVIRENSEEVVALEANINENSYNKTTGDNKDVQVEYRKQYPTKMTPNLNRESIEMPTILPGKMYINKDENTHEAKILPGNFNFKEDKERTKPTVLSPTNKKTEFSHDKFKLPKTPPNSAYIKSDEFVFEVPKILAENNNPVNTECSENASKTNILPRDNGLADNTLNSVQKMVVRMSSLDFEKQMDWEPKRKISIKEMPKKLSVLEKIALFEGKATPAITNPPRNKPLQFNTPPIIPEEVYLQKIEELQTAKLKFGKFEDMLYWKMDNGDEIPVLAIGTAMLDKRLIQRIVSAAIDMGYRAIDTAFIYGNEKEVGQAIRDKIKEGVVRREDLFIMSKLWSTFHRPDLVEKACRQSLEAMGLEYFDLYMIHNPMSFKEGGDPLPKIANILQYSDFDYLDAWYGMEDLVHKRLVKAIGVSNFNSQQLQRILNKGKIKPVVNQVECHPYLTQQRLRDFCSSKNIILSCFGTLGSKGTPAELTSGVAVVTDDPLVQVMASGLGVSPAQMLIRYQIDNGNQVVVKASTAAHLWDNLQALMFTLDNAHVDALDALNRNKRIFTFKGMGDTHKNYPFKTAF